MPVPQSQHCNYCMYMNKNWDDGPVPGGGLDDGFFSGVGYGNAGDMGRQ